MQNSPHSGRFAPSPTGPLHFGSLYSALASYLQARSNSGTWLVRIDDLDTFRNVPGSAGTILHTLEKFGLYWDGSISYQSNNIEVYNQILNTLDSKELLYPCTCSRKSLIQYRKLHPECTGYPGFCRTRQIDRNSSHALRVKTPNTTLSFIDQLQGKISRQLSWDQSDFIVKRRDRIIAYQLAVVVDDHDSNITEVVRGYDLLDSTPSQIFLQKQLGMTTPDYMHVPVITDQQGCKLSKQTFADSVDLQKPVEILTKLLQMLQQNPPLELQRQCVDEILNWAIKHWNPLPLQKIRAIPLRIDYHDS